MRGQRPAMAGGGAGGTGAHMVHIVLPCITGSNVPAAGCSKCSTQVLSRKKEILSLTLQVLSVHTVMMDSGSEDSTATGQPNR